MKIGTKSLLYGAHCFFIHPMFVFMAWWRLYGFPYDPRLWVAFVVHDWGYWGKPNMDGPEGESHVELGAKIMGKLFGPTWADFTRYHSRFYARKDGAKPSKLCYADKLATWYEWPLFYLLRATLTGEIKEYRACTEGKYRKETIHDAVPATSREWFRSVQVFCCKYAVDNYKK